MSEEIAYLAEHIATIGKNFIFIDTCSFLDILRIPYRSSNVKNATLQVNGYKLLRDSLQEKNIILVTQELVLHELKNHRLNVEHQLSTELGDLSLRLDIYHTCLALASQPLTKSYIDNFKNELVLLLDEILNYSLILRMDDSCELRGLKRTMACTPPAKKGKSADDCRIYEHFLELTLQCRKQNFAGSITFLSSNTKDYGKPSEGLIQEDENRLDFTYHSHIAGALKYIINDLSPQGKIRKLGPG